MHANLHGNGIAKLALSSLVAISHQWNGKLKSWGGFFFLQHYTGHIPPQGSAAPQPPPSISVVPVCSQQWHPELLSSDPWQNTSDSPKCATHSLVPSLLGMKRKLKELKQKDYWFVILFYHLRISRCIPRVIPPFPWELEETDPQGPGSTEKRELNAL